MANEQQQQHLSHSPPPGYRFNPTDQQLLGYYLIGKIKRQPLHPVLAGRIMEADLYGPDNEPDKVYSRFNISDKDCLHQEFYFFTFVKKKFETGKGNHMGRTAGKGSWKLERPKPVFDEMSGQEMGQKRTLNFKINNKNLTPSWIMHEYTLPNSDSCDHWAICRIKRGPQGKDSSDAASYELGSSSQHPSPILSPPLTNQCQTTFKASTSYGSNKRPMSSSAGGSADVDSYNQYGCNKKLRPSSPTNNYSLHPQALLPHQKAEHDPLSQEFTFLPPNQMSEKATLLRPNQLPNSSAQATAEPPGQYFGTSEDNSLKNFSVNEVSQSAYEGEDEIGEFLDNCADPDYCRRFCETMDQWINADEPSTCLPNQNTEHLHLSHNFADTRSHAISSSTTEVMAEILGHCESSRVQEDDIIKKFSAEMFDLDKLLQEDMDSGLSSSAGALESQDFDIHVSEFFQELQNTNFASPYKCLDAM